MTSPSHRDMILDQFSRQAVPFSTAPGIMDEQVLRLIIEFTGGGPQDTVLDTEASPDAAKAAEQADLIEARASVPAAPTKLGTFADLMNKKR